jgi:hypothetical protein
MTTNRSEHTLFTVMDAAEQAEVLSRIERLRQLLCELELVDLIERQKLRDRMQQELEAARIVVMGDGAPLTSPAVLSYCAKPDTDISHDAN